MYTDIIEQKEFDFLIEKNDIVLTNNVSNSLVKQLGEILHVDLLDISTEPFSTINTLGKIPSKKVHVINFQMLNDLEKRKDIFNEISKLKGNITVLIDTFEVENDYQQLVQEISEKILTNNYVFDKFKSKKEDVSKNFYFFGETEVYEAVKKGYVYGDCMNHAKDLVNTPYNYMNAEDLANYAKSLEKYKNVSVEIIEKSDIEKMNMGAFLGVNKGSSEEPKLIFMKYKGEAEFKNPTALVGKGVMYDTGGYSLKTPQSMPGMKVDMAGAAAVISAIEAIARLELKASVMAIVAATDNRIGNYAIVPDDILTSANGKTIEIVSTDAEGRLTLADAVWFAQQQGASKVIDAATLTGAMVAALGTEFTGAFTNDKEFYNEFVKASEKTNEPIWEMPISSGYRKELKSKVADLSNKGGRLAGASIAAAFIEEFIEPGTKWIHLDIAGTASKEKIGATGVMVKTFTELFY
ncbi:MAG: leucyl aminopeptidase family protein [Bacilli bacterium]|nr:leucyl aminopeptidase family protein [Bacilli bacterium]